LEFLVAVLSVFIFMRLEGQKYKISGDWAHVVGAWVAGVCTSWPLFVWRHENSARNRSWKGLSTALFVRLFLYASLSVAAFAMLSFGGEFRLSDAWYTRIFAFVLFGMTAFLLVPASDNRSGNPFVSELTLYCFLAGAGFAVTVFTRYSLFAYLLSSHPSAVPSLVGENLALLASSSSSFFSKYATNPIDAAKEIFLLATTNLSSCAILVDSSVTVLATAWLVWQDAQTLRDELHRALVVLLIFSAPAVGIPFYLAMRTSDKRKGE